MNARRAAARGSFTPTWLGARLRQLGLPRGARLCVAFSGGLDSTVLLAALAQLRARQGFALRAIHVNHHLQPAAGEFARAAMAAAELLRLPIEVLDVKVATRGQSIEAAAREARYGALRAALQPGEWLLTAQHQDDQLETVLLQLMRGAGLAGLAAMPALMPFGGGTLVRPLLPVARGALATYAQRRGLLWSEDPSNADQRFDRNYLRQQVLPLLAQRWPAAALTVARSAVHLAEAQGLLDALADAGLEQALCGQALRISALRRHDVAAQRNLLRRWLRRRGLPAPGTMQLAELVAVLVPARRDANPLVRWPGAEVRRHRGLLYAQRPGALAPLPCRWPWRMVRALQIPGAGRLEIAPHPHGELSLDALPAELDVRFRAGGERLVAVSGRKPLKNLLQELEIPPWQRERLPLLYAAGRLVAVAGCWVDPGYRADKKSKQRARLLFAAAADGNSD